MDVACLNLGYSVMSNVVSGSEAPFVNTCQVSYPKNKGWSNSEQKISMCSFNAAQFLSNYDLFGTQEVNSKYKDKFFDVVKSINMTKRFEFISSIYHGNTYIVTGYDRDKLGKAISLTDNMKLSSSSDDRAIQIIWFEKHKLLFINLHAPHNIHLKSTIEKVCRTIQTPKQINKIIMVGDFNDASGQLLKSSINIFGTNIKIPIYSHVPKTCCADSNYNYVGDYILTSDYSNKDIYFGTPVNYDRNTNLYSDHDPVVLLYK